MRAHSCPGAGGPPFHPPSQTPGAASAGRRAPTPTRPRQQRPQPPVPGFGAALPGPRYIAKGKHGHGWAQDGLPAPLPPLLTRIHPLFCGRGGAETGQRAGGGEARSKGVDSGKGMRAGPVTDTSPPLPSPPTRVAPEPQPPPHGTYGRRARPHSAGSGACAGRGPPRQPVSAGRGGALGGTPSAHRWGHVLNGRGRRAGAGPAAPQRGEGPLNRPFAGASGFPQPSELGPPSSLLPRFHGAGSGCQRRAAASLVGLSEGDTAGPGVLTEQAVCAQYGII